MSEFSNDTQGWSYAAPLMYNHRLGVVLNPTAQHYAMMDQPTQLYVADPTSEGPYLHPHEEEVVRVLRRWLDPDQGPGWTMRAG